MASLKDRLRDPVWQFIGAIAATASLVLALAICITPRLYTTVSRLSESLAGTTMPKAYQTDAPGPGCDKGGAHWTLLEGKVACTGQRAAYEDASVWVYWPGRAFLRRTFPPAYEIVLHADALGPTTCIIVLVRDRYGVSACASGGVQISRLNPHATTIASEPTRKFTEAQIIVRVDEHELTLTVFTFNTDDVITLTVDGDAYGSGDALAISVSPPDSQPAEHAEATLYDFQYRAIP